MEFAESVLSRAWQCQKQRVFHSIRKDFISFQINYLPFKSSGLQHTLRVTVWFETATRSLTISWVQEPATWMAAAHQLSRKRKLQVNMNIDIQIERWAVKRLIPCMTNPRTHSPEQIAQLAASIQEWGWTNPILVGAENDVIAGHARLRAARQLGMHEVPVIVLQHLTEAQQRALVIADNQLALNAGWDEELLRQELTALQEEDFDLRLLGCEDEELASLLAQEDTTERLVEEDYLPALCSTPVSQPGDLWLLGEASHQLLCGDATNAEDVKSVLSDWRPMLMVTDPPYGVRYDPAWRKRAGINRSSRMGLVTNDHRSDWREAWALFPGDVAYMWHGALHAATVAASLEACGFELRAEIVWAKPALVMGRGHYHWQHEPCWYAVRGTGHWQGDRTQSTLWQIANRQQDAQDRAQHAEAGRVHAPAHLE